MGNIIVACFLLTDSVYVQEGSTFEDKNNTRHRTSSALAGISRSRYDVIATKPVHRLQIRPIVHN